MTTTKTAHKALGNSPQELDLISSRLVSARLAAEPLAEFPGRLPDTLVDAYAVQSTSIDRWPDEVAGWKVGMVPTSYRESLGADRLTGPIFSSSVFDIEAGARRVMPIYSGGFAAVEAEFVFRLAASIEPVARDYSDEELLELVSALHVGAEIASSPMADVNRLGPCCVVSDFGNNAGLLIGPTVPNWHALPRESLTVKVIVDDKVVGTADAGAIEGGLLQALRFLINLSASRNISLAKGTVVSSGAVTGIHEVTNASAATVDFGSLGAFGVAFESMLPRQ